MSWSAVAGIASSAFDARVRRKAAKQQNAFNAAEASKSRAFTKEQLQNRHQWQVGDLRKAGLNPILSAGVTPSIGGSAQATSANLADAVGTPASTALQNIQQRANIELTRAQTRATDANTARTQATQPIYNTLGDVTKRAGEVGSSAIKSAEPYVKQKWSQFTNWLKSTKSKYYK